MLTTLWQIVRRLFWALFSLALIWLAVANRHGVTVSVAPLDIPEFNMPLYLIFFVGILVGLILAAGVTGWLRLRAFTKRRKVERRADRLTEQVSELSEQRHRDHAEIAHKAASD